MSALIEKFTLKNTAPDILFDKVFSVLIKALEADAVLVYSFDENLRRFEYLERTGVPEKKFEKLRDAVSMVLDADVKKRTARRLKKCCGSALKFNHDGAVAGRITTLLVYYFFERNSLVGAAVFLKKGEKTEKSWVDLLNRVAGFLLLLIENSIYREKTASFADRVNLDGLTGLYNHRYFQECFSNELLRAQRFDYPVSLLMLDVDHFKDYNDRYGHPKGDRVLKEIARILKKSIRAYDTPARYGGEEMVVILPYTSQQQALVVAERIRRNVGRFVFPGTGGNERVSVTVSMGVATFPVNGKTKSDVIDRADQALYLAKSEGRNRVCLSLAVSKKTISIGFCPAAFTSAYYHDILEGARDVTKEIPNIDLLIRAPGHETDYDLLKKILNGFVRKKVDAVALCTQSKTAALEIAGLNKAGIPVYMFNVPEKINDVKIETYVGYNQKEAGRMVGRYLVRILRGKGNIALIQGLDEPTSILRVAGFNEVIGSNPAMKIVAVEKADWLRDRARAAAERILAKHHEVDAIFAVNDEMALGVTDAVASRKKLGEIFVIGLDGTLDALNSINNARLTATLNTNPREMGRILIRTIVRGLIREEDINQEISSPINIVGLENVSQCL
jgi:diguanylate cyclase (GGDEF)-like protein